MTVREHRLTGTPSAPPTPRPTEGRHANQDAANTSAKAAGRATDRHVRLAGLVVALAGLMLFLGGATTWVAVSSNLARENITVAEDAARFGGEPVDGPLTAWYQADIIATHTLKAGGGLTFAELQRDDPRRVVVMNGSFLRASLFTAVVSFGVAALAMGLGIVLGITGWALRRLARVQA